MTERQRVETWLFYVLHAAFRQLDQTAEKADSPVSLRFTVDTGVLSALREVVKPEYLHVIDEALRVNQKENKSDKT